VAFSKNPKTIEDVKSELFDKDQQVYLHPYPYANDPENISYSLDQVASTILEDIKGQKPNEIKKMIEAVDGGFFEGRLEYENFKKSDGSIDWDKYQEANSKVASQQIKAFVYCFSYGDDDRYGCALEHGDLFQNLPNIQTSYH
jgi:hypothetical protein